VISDYTDPGPGAIYRAHIFTSSGTFAVSALGTYGSNVEYLVVAGGGGGRILVIMVVVVVPADIVHLYSAESSRGGASAESTFRINNTRFLWHYLLVLVVRVVVHLLLV
jgi:uncharacterized membrane protein